MSSAKLFVAAAIVLFAVSTQTPSAGEKDTERKPLDLQPAPQLVKESANLTAPPYAYFTPLGSFDLKDGGPFLYLRGTLADLQLKATMYSEDANYYYFYETNFPTWRWAFAKNQFNGQYSVWWTQGSNNFSQYSAGRRGSR